MNRAVNAALLSALVIPGGGQFFLGRRLRGMLFLVPTLVAAGYFLIQVMEPATAVAYDILEGRLVPEVGAVMARVHQISMTDTPQMNLAAIVMIACWIGSIVDAYRLGR
jgi:hypothetical protein